MSDKDSIWGRIQQGKDEQAILQGVERHFNISPPESLPTRTQLERWEVINHNQQLFFMNFYKEHYGMDFSYITDMVMWKELRNISLGRQGRTEAFNVYTMREIVKNVRQTATSILHNMMGGGNATPGG